MLMVVSPPTPTREAASGEERLKEYFTPLLLRLVRRAGEGGVGGGKELLLSEDDGGGGGGFMVWCVYECVGHGAAALAGSVIDERLSIDVGGALTASTANYNYLLCSTSQSSTE